MELDVNQTAEDCALQEIEGRKSFQWIANTENEIEEEVGTGTLYRAGGESKNDVLLKFRNYLFRRNVPKKRQQAVNV